MAQREHGTAMQAFVEHLVEHYEESLDEIREHENSFAQKVLHIRDAVEERVLRHFSFIAAVGEFAISLGILPWPRGHAFKAVDYVFYAWRDYRRENSLSLDAQVFECLNNAIQRRGLSGFHLLQGSGAVGNLGDAYGYRKEYGTYLELILPIDGFKRLFDKWLPRDVCQVLDGQGMLLRDGDNFTTKRAIPGNPKARCYVLKISHT